MRRLFLMLAVVTSMACGAASPNGAKTKGKDGIGPRATLPDIGDRLIELGGPASTYPSPIAYVALSNDGKRVAVVDREGILRVRNTASTGVGEEVGKIDAWNDAYGVGLAFSPSGALLAANDPKQGVSIFDVAKKSKVQTIGSSDAHVPPVFLSEDRVAIGERAHVRIVDLKTTNDVTRLTFAGDRAVVRMIAHAPKTGTIAACTFDRVMVWKAGGEVVLDQEAAFPTAVALTDDGSTFAYAEGSSTSRVRLVDLKGSGAKLDIPGMRDVRRLWLAERDVWVEHQRHGPESTLTRYDVGAGKVRYGPPDASAEGSAVAFAPGAKTAVVARGTELFRVDGHKLQRQDTPGRHGESVASLLVSADDRWLVSSAKDGMVLRWSLEKPENPPKLLLDKRNDDAHVIALSPDGKLVAMDTVLQYGGGLRVAPLEGGEPTFELDYIGRTTGLAFDGPGKLWLATDDGDVELHDLAAQEREREAPLTPNDEGALDSRRWDGSLLSPTHVVFRPHRYRDDGGSVGPSLSFTLPDGRPGTTLDDVSSSCRRFDDDEIVCPGIVRAKARGDFSYVVRVLDLKTGKPKLFSAPGAVQALAVSVDKRSFAVAVTLADSSDGPTAATKTALVIIDAARGGERARKSLPEAASALAFTSSGHVLVGHPSGAIHMVKP